MPELALDDAEADQLAHDTANVMKHYDVVISEKVADHLAFGSTVTAIYSERIKAILAARADAAGNRDQQAARQHGNGAAAPAAPIVPFTVVGPIARDPELDDAVH